MPCCSANRLQRSSAIISTRLETERFSKDASCSSLFRCSSRTVRLSFDLFLFFLDFAIRTLYTLVPYDRFPQVKKYTLKKVGVKCVLDIRPISVYKAYIMRRLEISCR